MAAPPGEKRATRRFTCVKVKHVKHGKHATYNQQCNLITYHEKSSNLNINKTVIKYFA